ncbi:uncharacterized protein SPSK_02396 [Sporothrix schenckii 1099-18]|uniref:Beta-glucuronidase C-terminal domain-containing protein n=2 Tax=Sporothrix schenckii TaxID=29908 RepID=U7PJ84_SPOS1|nr:uncharacterized protein SPSK_02396 [Sporothrix schenckii 1099-18]ERS95597.1 hypothetical protein HMPREF1624_08113 [Sporothrix schenckii ATCC 58251]KJR86614.1 hypothetical protein SPSK_02396 [Sporothrix schenckii 1099-18]
MRLDHLAARASAVTTVSVPASAPASAVLISPSFPGVSFELSTFSLYCQKSPTDSSANQYSINLIEEIYKRTGGRPLLRVGGTTGDTVTWNSALTQPISPAPGTSQTGSLTIGPNFWPLTKLLAPINALWVPQISYTDTVPAHAEANAQSIVSAIGLDNIGAIEIGNEPNEYGGHTGPSATGAQYFATRFQSIATNVSEAASIPSGPIFAGPGLAGEDQQSTDWTAPDLFANTTFDATGNIKYAVDHWYRCVGNPCVPAHMILHSNTVADANKRIQPYAAFFKSYKNGQVKYYLDEINIQTGGTSNQTLAYAFSTALYGVDFMLYAMTLGVAAVNWEQVYNSNQNVWQPSSSSTVPAQTKNIYYALITAAEFIGTGGTTKVVEIAPGNNDGTAFSAYVAYAGSSSNTPARVALCNLNYWDLSVGGSRPSQTVTVSGLPASLTSATVKYLTNPGGAVQNADHTTFGGSQWTFASLGKEVTGVQSTTVTVSVSNGQATVTIPDSAIAIVYL